MSQMNTPVDRAAACGMPLASSAEACGHIVRSMMEDLYRSAKNRPEGEHLREKIAAGYVKLTGAPIPPGLDDLKGYTSFGLRGPPGHGKSDAALAAAKEFCNLTGMNLVLDPVASDRLNQDDFVVVTHELTGETSTMTQTGMQDVQERDGERVLRRVPYERFAQASEAGCGMFLLDDFSSALSHIQTSFLGLLRNRKIHGVSFENLFPVTTGNVSFDGSQIEEGNSAIANRMQVMYVENTLEEWCKWYLQKDPVDAAYITAFLKMNRDVWDISITELAESDQPRLTPRSCDGLATKMRSLIHIMDHVGPGGEYFSRLGGFQSSVSSTAHGMIGSAGLKYAQLLDSVLQRVAPLAKFVYDSQWGKDWEKAYSGSMKRELSEVLGLGDGSEGPAGLVRSDAQKQYAEAMARIAFSDIYALGDKATYANVRDCAKRLTAALLGVEGATEGKAKLTSTAINLALHQFGSRVQSIKHLSQKSTALYDAYAEGLIDGVEKGVDANFPKAPHISNEYITDSLLPAIFTVPLPREHLKQEAGKIGERIANREQAAPAKKSGPKAK